MPLTQKKAQEATTDRITRATRISWLVCFAKVFDVSGTRHAVTSVRALGDKAQNTAIYSVFSSLYNILGNKTRSHALMPLAKMPQPWSLQHVCLSVHSCAFFVQHKHKNAVRSVFSRKHRRVHFALASTEPMVPCDFDNSRNESRGCDTQKPRICCVFPCPTATSLAQDTRVRNPGRLGFRVYNGFRVPCIQACRPELRSKHRPPSSPKPQRIFASSDSVPENIDIFPQKGYPFSPLKRTPKKGTPILRFL